MYHSTYFGCSIYRKVSPGFGLPWTSGIYCADTLAGLRKLIREGL